MATLEHERPAFAIRLVLGSLFVPLRNAANSSSLTRLLPMHDRAWNLAAAATAAAFFLTVHVIVVLLLAAAQSR